MNLTKYHFFLIKTDDGEFHNPKLKKTNKAFDLLEPGKYKISIEKVDHEDGLSRKKKYYFAMESHLAKHLGMTKKEMHESLKHVAVFQTIGPNGKNIYQSIEQITDEETMMQRIYTFQIWASEECNYTFDPYKDEK